MYRFLCVNLPYFDILNFWYIHNQQLYQFQPLFDGLDEMFWFFQFQYNQKYFVVFGFLSTYLTLTLDCLSIDSSADG